MPVRHLRTSGEAISVRVGQGRIVPNPTSGAPLDANDPYDVRPRVAPVVPGPALVPAVALAPITLMDVSNIRNVAVIAHVDHGKTTLVDKLLYQSGLFRKEELDRLAGGQHNLVMDTDDLERERGITILSKNCAIPYRTADGILVKINLIDTPGHADFGGEVERVLSMADGVLLVVDAFEGPMPQTRFVIEKALGHGLKPIVVVNKIDRPDARPDDVVNEVFDLLVALDADDTALDFPVIYASAKEGRASNTLDVEAGDMRDLFEAIVVHVPAPQCDRAAPLQMQISSLDYSEYTGRIGVGRIQSGVLQSGANVAVVGPDGDRTQQRVLHVDTFDGLDRKRDDSASAGDICAVVGLDPIHIGSTIVCPERGQALPPISVDDPTLNLTLRVNDGPFGGQEGQFVTSRQLAARLERELQANVALRVSPGETPEEFLLAGRGVMHLGILLENMRREGYEMCAGKPKVIMRTVEGTRHEPIESLVVDCPIECQGAVMNLIGDRRAEIVTMDNKSGAGDFVHMVFSIPARGLIGMRSRMMTATQGRAIMHHTFLEYAPERGEIPGRRAGVMVATEAGQVTAYALDALYDRGFFFVKPGDQVYEGQMVGEHCKNNDVTVNVTRTKKLTNVRAAAKDDAAQVRPAREMTLEACLEYVADDELVEITPGSIRMRKRLLKEAMRRQAARRGG